ncbi:rhodopsin-like [Penaeus chinensis]|uniref:rhodopsin-like n=1 Tax=Penaeus chinensis TaxID=139456 RepID=UPI001FB5B2CE|nr:rhodopsin-like [Penaeus chinensis]
MTACGTDYLTETTLSKSFLWVYSVWVYIFPLFYIYSYTFIVKTVSAHEKGMREQAKKMGVKSLRSEETQKTSAECRLCKVGLMTVTLWFMAWTPYFIINWGGMINKPMVTPIFSIWGSVFAKANAIYNPIVYAISHPKYRAALEKKLPLLACATEGREEEITEDQNKITEEDEFLDLWSDKYVLLVRYSLRQPAVGKVVLKGNFFATLASATYLRSKLSAKI